MIADLRVAVTFDDGFKDNFTTAAPILVKYRIPCTVFVASSFLRSPSALYLTREELKELAALPGVTIGSHGLTHNRLTACDEATLWRELTESRKEIEDIIGRPVMAISYPHGSVNRRIADTARLAGYALGACSRSDINHIGRDPLLLCRTEVVAADSKRVFLQKLNGGWDWCRWRRTDPAR
jgi:peptidoglycan/xylan/chitin deacetylase (PgdA/CDA1 family)